MAENADTAQKGLGLRPCQQGGEPTPKRARHEEGMVESELSKDKDEAVPCLWASCAMHVPP